MNIALRDLFWQDLNVSQGAEGWYAKSQKCSFRNVLYGRDCMYTFIPICKGRCNTWLTSLILQQWVPGVSCLALRFIPAKQELLQKRSPPKPRYRKDDVQQTDS